MTRLFLVDIAPLASGDKSNGHWYWVHKKISEIDNSVTFTRVDGDAEFGIKTLKGWYDYQNVTESNIESDVENIKIGLPQTLSPIIFHVYEGNYQSIFLACRLLEHFKNATAIVNLHWADQVASDLQINSKPMKKFRSALKTVLEDFKDRLYLQVESEKLANLMSKTLSFNIEPYLVFSVYDIPDTDQVKSYTALVSPSGESEFIDAIEGTKDLIENGNRVAINIATHLYPNVVSESRVNAARMMGYDVFISNLDEREYVALGCSAKIVVLTYSNDFYRWGSSGRLLDSVRFGSRIVIPEGTAIADQVLRNGWGTPYGKDSNLSISEAIHLELQSTTNLKQRVSAPGLEDFKANILEYNSRSISPAKKDSLKAWIEAKRSKIALRKYLVSSYQIKRSDPRDSIS